MDNEKRIEEIRKVVSVLPPDYKLLLSEIDRLKEECKSRSADVQKLAHDCPGELVDKINKLKEDFRVMREVAIDREKDDKQGRKVGEWWVDQEFAKRRKG